MNLCKKMLAPTQVYYYVRKQCYFNQKLVVTHDDGQEYDLQEGYFFDPFLLFHVYNQESKTVQTLMFDFSSEDGNIELLDGKIHVSDHPYEQWTIARADGTSISI